MKKSKFIAMSLVVALGLTGSAFAYWGQDITSNTTVNTGKLEVTVQNPECAAYTYGGDNAGAEWDSWVIADRGMVDKATTLVPSDIKDKYVKTAVDKNVVTAKVANMYPGSKVNVVYEVLNTGSIPVKIQTLKLGDIKSDLADHYNFEIQIVNQKNTTLWRATGDYTTIKSKLLNIGKELKNSIDPQDKVKVSIFAIFDRNIDDKNLQGDQHELEAFTFDVATGFTQFNAQ